MLVTKHPLHPEIDHLNSVEKNTMQKKKIQAAKMKIYRADLVNDSNQL